VGKEACGKVGTDKAVVRRRESPCARDGPPKADISSDSTYCRAWAVNVSRNNLVEAAKVGRVATVSAKAQALRSATQRRQAAALKAWNPADKPDWLDEKTYREKIQPRLAWRPSDHPRQFALFQVGLFRYFLSADRGNVGMQ